MIPIIKKTDFHAIINLVENLAPTQKTKELGVLQSELRRAKTVADHTISDKVIQLGTYFEIRELSSGAKLSYHLVLPKYADLANKKISVLSPLGVALIGFQEGATFEWEMPGGRKKFVIEKVQQP